MEYKVIVGWDKENEVFFIVESDIKGLWLEKPTFEALLEAIKDVAPDLIRQNHPTDSSQPELRIYRDIGDPVRLNYAA